jgi:DNA-directed RNA polymerase subunit RPC12/RpoP
MPDLPIGEQEFWTHCDECGHEWLVAVIPMNVDDFCRKLNAAVAGRCPRCDSKLLLCGKRSQAKE